jgi:hypothetical protein
VAPTISVLFARTMMIPAASGFPAEARRIGDSMELTSESVVKLGFSWGPCSD